MLNNIIVNEDLVLMNLKAVSNLDAINQIAQNLLSNHLVYPTYIDAIKERELQFSTGLPGVDFGIAIPHTDSNHVISDAISIAVLNSPVNFKMMGTDDIYLPAEMIFMLAIKGGDNQIKVLQSLIDLFQQENALLRLQQASSEKELVKLFKEFFKGKEQGE